jgi:predicted enzyme involved in methoxymalonyl-ACP biosynthesis
VREPLVRSSAEYLAHLREGLAHTSNDAGLPELKLLVLADHTSEPLTHVLASLLKRQGFFAKIERKGLDASGSAADYTVLSISVQEYRARFFASSPQARATLPRERAREILELARTSVDRGGAVIVNTLALPRERLFGNSGISTSHSLYGSVMEFNRALVVGVRALGSCYINDVMYLCNLVGAAEFLDDRLWALSKHLCRPKYHLPLAESIVRIILATRGRVVKCVIVNPDNVLWGGMIEEGRLKNVDAAYQDFQRYLLTLKHRGMLLAIVSQHENEVTRKIFKEHPSMVLKDKDIDRFSEDATGGVNGIIRALALSPEHVVLLEHASFERVPVRGVHVLELPQNVSEFVAYLETSGLFEVVS